MRDLSSLTRDQTHVPCIVKQTLNHWTTGDRASLVAQTVRNLPEMQETQVQSLDWEDPLEKGMDTDSSILA